MSLGNYIDSYVKQHSKHGEETDFIRITLKGLAALIVEHGAASVQYKTAAQIVKEFLQLVIDRKRLTLNRNCGDVRWKSRKTKRISC